MNEGPTTVKHFRAILEHSIDAIAVLSSEGKVLYSTPSVETVLGYTNEEAKKMDVFSLTHPKDSENFSLAWQGILNAKGKEFPVIACRIKHKNGTWRWIEPIVKNLLLDPSVNGIIAIFRDVTDKVETEVQNGFDRTNLMALIDNTDDLMWSIDRDYKLITANKGFLEVIRMMSGITLNRGDSIFLEGFPQEVHQRYKNIYKRVFESEVVRELEYVDQPTEAWSEISYYPIWNEDLVIGVACHSKDITVIKKAENERIRNEARLKDSQELAKLGHWELNFASGKAIWSEETCRIYGVPIESVNHALEEWKSFIHPEDKAEVLVAIDEAHKTLSELKMDYRIMLRDGTVKHISSITKFEFDKSGKIPVGLYGIAYDITTEKKVEIQLKQKANELEFSNAELERFAYSVSHDLQEPLRTVTGFLSLLERKYSHELDDKAKKYIQYAMDGSKRMRQIIIELLEYSRVGKTNEDLVDLDLNELVVEITMLLNRQVKEKKAVILYKNLPIIRSSKSPIQQVFQNLISNGLKYNNDGIAPKIEIKAKEEKDHWIFSISDNGIGINKESHEKVFAIFQRLHSKEISGAGIGLAITKKVIEHLGGKIWLESEGGRGSVFYFTLPK